MNSCLPFELTAGLIEEVFFITCLELDAKYSSIKRQRQMSSLRQNRTGVYAWSFSLTKTGFALELKCSVSLAPLTKRPTSETQPGGIAAAILVL